MNEVPSRSGGAMVRKGSRVGGWVRSWVSVASWEGSLGGWVSGCGVVCWVWAGRGHSGCGCRCSLDRETCCSSSMPACQDFVGLWQLLHVISKSTSTVVTLRSYCTVIRSLLYCHALTPSEKFMRYRWKMEGN